MVERNILKTDSLNSQSYLTYEHLTTLRIYKYNNEDRRSYILYDSSFFTDSYIIKCFQLTTSCYKALNLIYTGLMKTLFSLLMVSFVGYYIYNILQIADSSRTIREMLVIQTVGNLPIVQTNSKKD